ncbi:tetratricopeptide repeat protein [Marinobacter oulmenensis]|uniref:Putative PEP-CTERM system TPR-repeat lipoprotein n=1 Tax=Marinobacter oulmenensis TaxID=643747 RepID=A0A840UIN3_9GAMM|nr:putative PEP-CTERM system TPR-repeat lipoprotein [Marinobacter oulmenensis]
MKTGNTSRKPFITSALLIGTLLLPIPVLTGCSNDKNTSDEAASHITRADTYIEQKQYRSAMLELRNALQTDPGNAQHVVKLANLYLTIGTPRQASELLEPWLEEHTQTVALPLAQAYVDQRKHLSARETLDRFTPETAGDQLSASLIRAEAARIAGNRGEALSLFSGLVDSHPSNPDAIAGLVQTYVDLGRTREAIAVADDWMARNRPLPEVGYWKGMAQYRQNELELSAQTLTEAASNLPTADVFLPVRRDVLTLLSRVLTEQGKTTDAQVYNKILAENQNTEVREQSEAAIAALREGKVEEAKSVLRDMLKVNPDSREAALMLGALTTDTGEVEEGARLLTENLDPETTPTPFLRAAAMAQIDTGDRVQALETLERAMEARPNDNDIAAMHGVLALTLEDQQEAGIISLSKVLDRQPDRTRLRLALAQHYIGQNQPEQALAQLRRAFASRPDDWETTAAYLELLLDHGEQKEAAETRDALINGYADAPTALYLASVVDARLGNLESARQRLEALVEKQPDFQRPRLLLARLHAQAGNTGSAIDQLLEAARLAPNNIQPLQEAGRLYAQNHSPQEVLQWLDDIASDNDQLARNADLLSTLVHVGLGNFSDAHEQLAPWIDSDAPDVRRTRLELLVTETRAALSENRYPDARAKAAEAISLAPDNLQLALLPAGISQAGENYDQALTEIDAVEQTFGETPRTILARASILESREGATAAYDYLARQWQQRNDGALAPTLLQLTSGQSDPKREALTREWLDRQPDSPAAHMARADWLLGNGQEELAAVHYESVLKFRPANTAALNNLAWLLRESDTDRALTLSRRAMENAPNSPAVLDTHGWILHLAGQHSEAVSVLENASRLAPESQEILGHLETARRAM